MTRLTRAAFELVASVIFALEVTARDRDYIACCFADAFAATNSHFDRARFMRAACGEERGLEVG